MQTIKYMVQDKWRLYSMKITIREPGSALTHYIAMMLAMLGAVPLLMKATNSQDMRHVVAMLIFICSMVLLYGASTLYHSVNLTGKALKVFKKIDHMMIFVLIAGSYTPVCMLVLDKAQGYPLLGLVWGTAIVGMLIKFFWVTCPKWFSSIIYIAMGWECLLVFRPLLDTLPTWAFLWLLIGGIVSFINSGSIQFSFHDITNFFYIFRPCSLRKASVLCQILHRSRRIFQ